MLKQKHSLGCPVCHYDHTEVLEKRGDRRRRRCKRCKHPFTTYELAEAEVQRLRTVEAKARDLATMVSAE